MKDNIFFLKKQILKKIDNSLSSYTNDRQTSIYRQKTIVKPRETSIDPKQLLGMIDFSHRFQEFQKADRARDFAILEGRILGFAVPYFLICGGYSHE